MSIGADRHLKLGIVGGLGTRAGADILNQIVRLTPVKSESDHREISFEQKPLLEPVSAANREYSPTHRKFYVFDTLARMEKNGCDAALLPCFITHTFIEELRAELGIKLISMTDAIGEYIRQHHSKAKRIGVLTTRYVREKRLFDILLGPDVEVLYPTQETETDMLQAIYGSEGFKAGNSGNEIKACMGRVIEDLVERGAEIILPGMTEIPLMNLDSTKNIDVPQLNTNEIYARFALKQTSGLIAKPFKIGIVGGVGPAATIDFMSKLVNATEAECDQDHVKLLVEQNPQIPDRTLNLIADGVDPTLALYSTCKKLEAGGADLIAIPCNTAHAYVDRIQRHLNIPIVNILTETITYIQKHHPEICKVGILATSGTIASGLYQEALFAENMMPIVPNANIQSKVMEAIYGDKGVKAGFINGLCLQNIKEAISALTDAGAEGIILGCTELPLIAPVTKSNRLPILFDPTQILAQKCIEFSGKSKSDIQNT
ncbi:MAG: aspartate/glutamate racemase family protein [Rhizobiaceae bacterium]|nr:aspartate/glutamate racemase family protein [Rhizobiaceae bacterium]